MLKNVENPGKALLSSQYPSVDVLVNLIDCFAIVAKECRQSTLIKPIKTHIEENEKKSKWLWPCNSFNHLWIFEKDSVDLSFLSIKGFEKNCENRLFYVHLDLLLLLLSYRISFVAKCPGMKDVLCRWKNLSERKGTIQKGLNKISVVCDKTAIRVSSLESFSNEAFWTRVCRGAPDIELILAIWREPPSKVKGSRFLSATVFLNYLVENVLFSAKLSIFNLSMYNCTYSKTFVSFAYFLTSLKLCFRKLFCDFLRSLTLTRMNLLMED